MRALLRLALVLATSGCTLVNAPDPDRRYPDGGPMDAGDAGDSGDTGMIEDAGDGGPDAGDADTGMPLVENCSNGEDDDEDGLVDCEDFDCAAYIGEGACCREEAMVPLFDVDAWPTNLDDDWDASRRVDTVPLFPEVDSGRLAFTRSDDPHALVWESCLPLGLGAELRADFGPRGDLTTCDSEGRCADFAALVLSPVAEQRVPRRLVAELAVTFHASGRVDISQDETLLTTTQLDPLTAALFYQLEVDLVVDTDDRGRGVLRTFVRVRHPSGALQLNWEAPLISLRNLFFDRAACQDSAGLRFAFEGAGGDVEIGRARAGQLACTNPGQFLRRELDPLTTHEVPGVVTASLDFDDDARTPRWADEALMSASLLGRGATDPVWHVAAEATNDQPELVTTARVGWAIGYAFESTWNVDTWSDASSQPILGSSPASCLDGTCTMPRPAAREPHLFEADGVLNVVYAAELETTETFELRFARGVTTATATGLPLLAPDDEPSCDSLRDPAIVPRGGVEDGYWLFFTCESGALRSIRARALTVGLGGLEPTADPSEEVLTSDDLGAFARDGVRSPEPILDGDVYRLWFLGLDDVTGPSVGVAVGQPKEGAPAALPSFVPYPANPVLQSGDPAFADCLGCTLEGLAVARHPDRVDRLRFLVTRRVPMSGGGRRFELMPLDQTWRATR
ncbi:MAG: hypothetical protein H6722_23150 [Sandaracinus sp.]|nr:hypothetical protein [Sandaracinus sp.]